MVLSERKLYFDGFSSNPRTFSTVDYKTIVFSLEHENIYIHKNLFRRKFCGDMSYFLGTNSNRAATAGVAKQLFDFFWESGKHLSVIEIKWWMDSSGGSTSPFLVNVGAVFY